MHHARAAQPHGTADVSRLDAAAQQPQSRLRAGQGPRAALEQLRVLAHVLAHKPHQILHDPLLSARGAVAVVQEQDHPAPAYCRPDQLAPGAPSSQAANLDCPDVPAVPASIIVPTRARPSYLQVALASISPQAAAEGAEVLVIDDAGPTADGRALAERFRARYEPHPRPLGLNAAPKMS